MQLVALSDLTTLYNLPTDVASKGMLRYRKGLSKSWRNTKSQEDQRKVLIDLDTIPEGTRLKYGIPTGEEYQKQLEKVQNAVIVERVQEQKANSEWEDLKTTNNHIKRLVYAYESDYQQYLADYAERFSYNEKLSKDLPFQYAKEHAFWLEMVHLTGSKWSNHYGAIGEFFPLFIECKKHLVFEDHITSEPQFRRKINLIRKTLFQKLPIVDIIVPAFYNAKINKKTNDFHVLMAVSIYGHPNKYTYVVTADMINYHCEQENQPTISESWVKTLFRTDNKLKTLVKSTRSGAKYFNDNILPHAIRNVTLYPGNIWMIDGTPIQMYCWNKERTRSVRLNVFVVIDVASRKIVGFDVSYTEDKFNIIKALEMAVKSTGHLPKEIVSDNFSGKKSEEIMDIKEQMERLGSVWRHARVKNPQDKSYVERFFAVFQSVEQALYGYYIGESVWSKNPNARRDPEYIAHVAKEKGLLTYYEMIDLVGVMIARYNKREKSTRPSPNEAYASFPKPNIIEMDIIRTALFFWTKTVATVRRGMVKIKVRKIEHVFEVYDNDIKMKYQDKQVTVRYDQKDLDSIMLFDEKDNVICECKKSLRINMGVADRTEEDVQNTYKIVAKKKSYEKHIDEAKAELMDKGLKAIGKETLDIVNPLALEKNQVNDRESQEFLQLHRELHGITADKEYKEEYSTVAVIKQKHVVNDVREKLLEKKPSEKGSLRRIPSVNR